MTIKIITIVVLVLFGAIAGYNINLIRMIQRSTDGVCLRTDEGEAYLRISEEGQRKLIDPSTKFLYIRVVDVTTRNKHLL